MHVDGHGFRLAVGHQEMVVAEVGDGVRECVGGDYGGAADVVFSLVAAVGYGEG